MLLTSEQDGRRRQERCHRSRSKKSAKPAPSTRTTLSWTACCSGRALILGSASFHRIGPSWSTGYCEAQLSLPASSQLFLLIRRGRPTNCSLNKGRVCQHHASFRSIGRCQAPKFWLPESSDLPQIRWDLRCCGYLALENRLSMALSPPPQRRCATLNGSVHIWILPRLGSHHNQHLEWYYGYQSIGWTNNCLSRDKQDGENTVTKVRFVNEDDLNGRTVHEDSQNHVIQSSDLDNIMHTSAVLQVVSSQHK